MKANIGVILLAGGTGKRAQQSVPKQFLLIGGKPMIVHSLEKIEALENISGVVVPCAPENIEQTSRILSAWGFDRVRFRIIQGGTTRQKSVALGLEATEGCDYVIIHEAARPLVSINDFVRLINTDEPNAVLAAPLPFTVALTDEEANVSGLLDRSRLANVQLPQIFEHRQLAKAHRMAAEAGKEYTEDATLLLDQLGIRSKILEGSQTNIKVTYPSDVVIAQAIYDNYIVGGING